MRMIFSLVGLIIAVAIVGILTKKQLAALTTLPDVVTPATVTPANPANPANIGEQSKQMQTQVKDQLNEAMKAAAEAQQKALEVGNGDKPTEKTGSAY